MAEFSDLVGIPYSGLLTPEECAEGINLARVNAARLIQDACTLFAAARYPSAAQFAILAIEESGKEALLRTLAAAETDDEADTHWKDYRSHRKKNVRWAAPKAADLGYSFPELLASTKQPELAIFIERFKQMCTYTDCVNERHWSSPDRFVNAAAAADLIDRARRLSAPTPVSAKEIEIGARHERRLNRAVRAGAPIHDREEIFMQWQAELRASGFAALTEEGLSLLKSHSVDLKGIGRKKGSWPSFRA